MLDNILIGKYIPKNSEVHSLNSVFKFLSLIIMLIASAFINSYQDVVMLLSYLILTILYSGIDIKVFIKEILFTKVLIFIILLVDIIFLNPINIIICDIFRFIFIFIYASIYLHVTTLNEQIFSLEKILDPLGKFTRDTKVSLYLALAFKFPYYYFSEIKKINKIYKERNINKKFNFKENIYTFKDNIVLAFNNSIEKLYKLSDDMKLKLYGYGKSRTSYHNSKVMIKEKLLIVLNIVILIIVIFY